MSKDHSVVMQGLSGLLSKAINSWKLSYVSPSDRATNLKDILDGYVSFSYELKNYVDTVEPFVESVDKTPVPAFLATLKSRGSRDVMNGPDYLAKFADLALTELEEQGLMPPLSDEAVDQLEKIDFALSDMVREGAVKSYEAASLSRRLSQMPYALDERIKLEHIQLDYGRLSAHFADDQGAANRERETLAAFGVILDRIEPLTRIKKPFKDIADINAFVESIYDDSNNNLKPSEGRINRMRNQLIGTDAFDSETHHRLTADVQMTESLHDLAKLRKPGHTVFPTKDLQWVLMGKSDARFNRSLQRDLVESIQEKFEGSLGTAALSPIGRQQAVVHGRKIFGILKRHFDNPIREHDQEKTL